MRNVLETIGLISLASLLLAGCKPNEEDSSNAFVGSWMNDTRYSRKYSTVDKDYIYTQGYAYIIRFYEGGIFSYMHQEYTHDSYYQDNDEWSTTGQFYEEGSYVVADDNRAYANVCKFDTLQYTFELINNDSIYWKEKRVGLKRYSVEIPEIAE